MPDKEEIKRLAANPIALMRWLLDHIEAGDFTMADVKEAFREAAAQDAAEEFEAVAAGAWAEWSEDGEQ